MVVEGKNVIKVYSYLTVDKLDYLDVFVFMDRPEQVCIRVDDGFWDLETAEYYENYDYEDIPVKKLKCKLVIEE